MFTAKVMRAVLCITFLLVFLLSVNIHANESTTGEAASAVSLNKSTDDSKQNAVTRELSRTELIVDPDVIQGSSRFEDIGLTVYWSAKGSNEPAPDKEGEKGFSYCKLGTGWDGNHNITGERYAYGPNTQIVLGGHYENLNSGRWCGNGWYRPDGSIYYENKNQFYIPSPQSEGYESWNWYNVVFYWDNEMPSGMQDVEGSWTSIWYDAGSNACSKYYTVMYDLTDHTMCKGVYGESNEYDPNTRTNNFSVDDYAAYSWLRLDDYALNFTNDVKWEWYGPDGHYATTEVDAENPGSEPWYWLKAWAYIPIENSYPSTRPGNWYVDVYVKNHNGNYEKKYTESFTISGGTADCDLSPSSLNFGSVEAGGCLTKPFTITNSGSTSLSGTVSLNCDGFQLLTSGSYSLAPGSNKIFPVRFCPTTPMQYNCNIETGSSECADLSCSGIGYVDNQPICEIIPTPPINFGTVDVGSYVDKTFTIRNVGTGNLTGEVYENCSQFSIINGAGYFNLSSNQSESVTVRFQPQSEGGFSCNISMGDSYCGAVNCVGTGGAPQLTELQVEGLTFYADFIDEVQNDLYQLSGNVNINGFLYFSGQLEVNLGFNDPYITGNGSITTPNINYFGVITLYSGEIDFHVNGTNLMEFSYLSDYTNFKVGGFAIEMNNVTFIGDGIMIAGCIDFPETIGGGVDLDNLSISRSGGLVLVGRVDIPDISINNIGLSNMYAEFDTQNNIFGGGLLVSMEPLVSIGGELQFIQGSLNRVYLEVGFGQGIPIDATGLSLSGGEGGLDHLADAQPVLISLTVDITGGPQVNGVAVVKFNNVGVEIQYPLYLKGMGGLQVFNFDVAYAEAIYQNHSLSLDGGLELGGILDGSFDARIWDSRFTGSYEAGLHTPSDFPDELWWLSWAENIYVGYVESSINNDQMQGMATIGAWPFQFDLAYRAKFGKPSFPWFHFYIGENYNNLYQIFKWYKGSDLLATYLIPEGTENVLFFVRSYDPSLPEFYLINPSGDTLGSGDLPFASYPAEGYSFYLVNDPMIGQWDVFVPDAINRNLEIVAKAPNLLPFIKMNRPAIRGDENLIEWDAKDFDDDAEINFYFDNDNRDFDGLPVNENPVKEDSRVNSIIWDHEEVDPGEYYIYAVIEDTSNAPVRVYGKGTIIVEDATNIEAPSGFQGKVDDSTVVLVWNPVVDQNRYVVFFQNMNDNAELPSMTSVNDTTICYIYDLPFGNTYKFWVAVGTEDGNVGDYSDQISLQLTSPGINNVPIITSLNPPEDAIVGKEYEYSVEATDDDGDPIEFNLTEFPEGMFLDYNHIFWMPEQEQAGVAYVEVIAFDPFGASDTLGFEIKVFDQNYLQPKLRFDANIYKGTDAEGFVKLKFYNPLNSDIILDTATVVLSSGSDERGIQLDCIETDAQSYEYIAHFGFTPGASQGEPSLIRTNSGDDITVSFNHSDFNLKDISKWFSFPTGCKVFDSRIEPSQWPELWLNTVPGNNPITPPVRFIIESDAAGGRSIHDVKIESVRLNNLVAPLREDKAYIDSSLSTNRLVLNFNPRLAIYSLGEVEIGGIYPLTLYGLFKDGETFCAEGMVKIIPYSHNDAHDKVVTKEFDFRLEQNSPNPFNPETKISFALREATEVRIDIYNVAGQRVKTLANKHYEIGNHSVNWDGKDDRGVSVSSGLYFYRITTDFYSETKKMLLIK